MSVLIEKSGSVTTVVLARSEARNAVDPATAAKLTEAFLAFDADPGQHVAVFWGAGGAFCAGFDLKHASSLGGKTSPLAPNNFPKGDGPVPPGPMGPGGTGPPPFGKSFAASGRSLPVSEPAYFRSKPAQKAPPAPQNTATC